MYVCGSYVAEIAGAGGDGCERKSRLTSGNSGDFAEMSSSRRYNEEFLQANEFANEVQVQSRK